MGAPKGNQNAVKAKRWQQAIDRALTKRSKAQGIEELDRLAEKFLDAVEDMTIPTGKRGPSIAGFIELADRIEGKPDQTVFSARIAMELADDELLNIARSSGDGTAAETVREAEPSSVH